MTIWDSSGVLKKSFSFSFLGYGHFTSLLWTYTGENWGYGSYYYTMTTHRCRYVCLNSNEISHSPLSSLYYILCFHFKIKAKIMSIVKQLEKWTGHTFHRKLFASFKFSLNLFMSPLPIKHFVHVDYVEQFYSKS